MENNEKEIKERLKEDMKHEKFRPFWTWYIFLFINVIVIVGAAVSWILFTYSSEEYWLPTLICNIVSLAGLITFMIFEAKDLKLKMFHTKKKWTYYIVASVCIYGLIVIASSILVCSKLPIHKGINDLPIELVCNFAIGAGLSLVAIGLYRYGRFHIDKDIFARKHGVIIEEQIKAEKIHEENRSKVASMSEEEFKVYKDKIDTTPDHEKIGREASSGISHEKFDDK